MGIFGALVTSVAGMRAQSFALENISGNIANSQTTAFKRVDSSFLDLVPDAVREYIRRHGLYTPARGDETAPVQRGAAAHHHP